MDEYELSPQELFELWLAASDEQADGPSISDAQCEALNRLIVENPDVRQQLIALSRQQAWLMWHGSATKAGSIDANNVDAVVARVHTLIERTDRSTTQKPVGVLPLSRFLTDFATEQAAVFRPPLVFCTLLLACAGAWLLGREIYSSKDEAAGPIAYLTSANGCDWGNGPLQLNNVGSGIGAGDDLTLYEGIADFRLESGAIVNVEAPASLIINSPSSLVLLYGKVTVHTPWQAPDFKVIAGPCQFASRDSEFGMIHHGRNIEMHVFSGEVQATNLSFSNSSVANEPVGGGVVVTDDVGTFGRAVIMAESAISLLNDDNVVKVTRIGYNSMPQMFATKLSMSEAMPASGGYEREVLKSKPVGYWRFERIRNGSVVNEIPGGANLKVIGNLRLAGQPDNLAAEFLPGGDCYLFSERDVVGTDELSNYSLEAWVKPSYVHKGGVVSLVSDVPNSHATRLEMQGSPNWPGSGTRGSRYPATIRFIHHNLLVSKNEEGWTECFSKERYLLRRWQHVVAVKERSSMRLYLNSKLVATTSDKSPLSLHSRLAVGQDTFRYANERAYVGQIDEVAFYDRALSDKEIDEHFGAPDWDGKSEHQPSNGI
ncbi:MAG: LamG domain-containing protein [Pirellulales bacterium]